MLKTMMFVRHVRKTPSSGFMKKLKSADLNRKNC